jgi:hypothetical protein
MRFRDVAADTVGRFADETATGTGQARQFNGQGVQLCRLRMLLGGIAKENRAFLAFEQAGWQ